MGVDAFVMPLWKYHVGDFETPLEASGLAREVTYVSPLGLFHRQRWTGWWARRRAKHAVAQLMRAVSDANGGVPVQWADEGSVVASEQFRCAQDIHAYLWWSDRRDVLGEFLAPAGGDDAYAERFWGTEPHRAPRFPHLSDNGYFNDYFLPTDFPKVAAVPSAGPWGGTERASSTPRAWGELQQIDRDLPIPTEWEWDEADPLSSPRMAFWRLRKLLELSERHALPVIFWG
jgi:hypothetical protein